ncbi:MAG TPA: trigger factor [Gemmatimonadaceae bacterium]|nr:trigger factor [Gemmatimonadaceae bacterium]
MNITVTPKRAEGLERVLEVSVPAEEVRGAEARAARKYAGQARLPGFRPGKAPPAMVQKKFAGPIRQEAIESLLQEAYQAVLEREKLSPASQPRVEHLHVHDGEPMTFELHLEVRPEIALERTQGFRVTREAQAVTEEQVAEQIEHLREQRATWTPLTEKPLPGDMVTATLATSSDDGEMLEGKEYRIVLGGGQAIPGIEEIIMEAAPGETVERPVRWPDDFPDESQRGKTKTVRVTLGDVKRKTLPELDDAFAREVGDFDSLDALRAAVREDLTRHADREADAQVRNRLLEDLMGANPFDVPSSWVDRYVDAYVGAYGIPDEERDKFRAEFRPMADRQVRRDLIVETIAERESLKATEADIDDRVADVAAKRNEDPGRVYASLQKSGRLRELEASITEDKVFEWLLGRNEVERK